MELLQIAVDKLIGQVKLLTSDVKKLQEKIAVLEKQQFENDSNSINE